ncbi:MAG: sensor domain-containing diguanylate cyclase [Ignavibacteriales bacterium]|nr:sensor domain-containing diguanylate cyclase [Ignavibacteriales bacterium]
MDYLKDEECLSSISEILSTLKSTNQSEKVLHLIVHRLVKIFKCQTCAVVVVNPNTEYLNVLISCGLSLTFVKAFRRRLTTNALGKLLWTGKPVIIQDSAQYPQLAGEVKHEHPFGSCAAVQIAVDHRTLGYLYVDSTDVNEFSENDISTIQSFADFAGLALQKSYLYEENLRLDNIDHETELEKYSSFLERVESSIERCEQFGVMILDVDNFKHIALTYGYDISKKVLKEIASLVKSKLRHIDVAGRYGFDEFILLRANALLENAVDFANEVRESVEHGIFTEKGIHTTISIGVAAYPKNARSIDALLLTAKEALFEAQRAGRNQVFSHLQQSYENTPALHDG